MKLRLPSLLLSAVVALQFLTITNAAVTGSGVSYDVGKGSYSSDPAAHGMGYYDSEKTSPKSDTLLCWAASGSNLIQYWQDVYYTGNAANGTPNGHNQQKYSLPDGTRYLSVYETFIENVLEDSGGTQPMAWDWWFKQTADQWGTLAENSNKCYSLFDNAATAAASADLDETPTKDQLKATLDATFSTKGQAAGLYIFQVHEDDGPNVDYRDLQSRYHAISCWGYETNQAGNLTAIFLSDSDDMEFGVFKVDVSEIMYHDWMREGYGDEWPADYQQLALSTDDSIDGYSGKFMPLLKSIHYIDTNASSLTGTSAPAVNSSVNTNDGNVVENTNITGDNEVTGKGIRLGNGSERIVMLTSDYTATLSLNGENTNTTGIEVTAGSLTSLNNLTVTRYNEGGLKLDGKTYLHDGSLVVSENSSDGNGAGINTTNYLEIRDNKSVSITNNTTATGKGGGIYNTDIVSIRGNEEVAFQGNSAAQGSDIYNAAGGSVNIADNKQVTFAGTDINNKAVVNDGKLYLTAKSGDNIKFQNSALETQGTTYVGKDISNRSTDTQGSVLFTSKDGGEMTICAHSVEGVAFATLEKLTVNAKEITGATNNLWTKASSITNADIAVVGMLTMRNIALDSTDVIQSTGDNNLVTFDNVIITLASTDEQTNGTYDLTGMFRGSFKIKSLYFDVTGLGKNVDPTAITINLGDDLTSVDGIENVALWLGDNLISPEASFNGGLVGFSADTMEIPEPTTGTLGLLALAGLCGRRRRR